MPIRIIRPAVSLVVSSLAAAFAFGLAGAARAADLLVPSQYPTIQAAVNALGANDTIRVAPGTYNESVVMNIRSNASIQTVNLVCSDPTGYFTIIPPSGRGLSIVAGFHDGYAIQPVTIEGGRFLGPAGSFGGGVDANGNVTLKRCRFEACRTLNQPGGALIVRGRPVTCLDCLFEGNRAEVDAAGALANKIARGGAIAVDVSDITTNTNLICRRCDFVGNVAAADGGSANPLAVLAFGGAISLTNSATVSEVSDCRFIGNHATASASGSVQAVSAVASALYVRTSGVAHLLQRLSFSRNSASAARTTTSTGSMGFSALGALFMTADTPVATSITDVRFFGNTAILAGPVAGGSAVADGCFPGGAGAPRYVLRASIGSSSWTSGGVDGASMLGAHLTNSTGCSLPSAAFLLCIVTNYTQLGTCPDCDGDGLPDLQELAEGFAFDTNANAIPDICEPSMPLLVPSQYPTIQSAVAAVPVGSSRTIQVAAGTYPGPIDFLGKDIALVGSGAATCTIDGSAGQTKSVVQLSNAPATARIEGFTIRNGATGTPLPGSESALCGGGIFAKDSQASVVNCVIESNTGGFGGGIYFYDCAGFVTGCTVRGNIANAYGGGVLLFRSSTVVDGCLIEGNISVVDGGGLHAVLGTPRVRATTIRSNFANAGGGGLSWDAAAGANSALVIEDSVVTKNDAQNGVGGVRVFPMPQLPTLSLVATEVCGNAGGNIEGFYLADGASTVCECAGDVDGSGVVNGVDLSALLSVWGTSGAQYPRADADRDGIVTAADLAIVLSGWGPCAP